MNSGLGAVSRSIVGAVSIGCTGKGGTVSSGQVRGQLGQLAEGEGTVSSGQGGIHLGGRWVSSSEKSAVGREGTQ